MIDLYTWTTPNGRKVSIALEEMEIPYAVHTVDLGKGEQHEPGFRRASPNGKIPAIVDREGDAGRELPLFESGAILIHLAERAGRFLPGPDRPGPRGKVLEWLMWQMANVGPMFGQANHFANQAPERVPYALERYLSESARLLRVLDGRLAESEHLAGEYSVADMATYPWVAAAFETIRAAKPDAVGEGRNVRRWLDAVGARPAVQRGMEVPTL